MAVMTDKTFPPFNPTFQPILQSIKLAHRDLTHRQGARQLASQPGSSSRPQNRSWGYHFYPPRFDQQWVSYHLGCWIDQLVRWMAHRRLHDER